MQTPACGYVQFLAPCTYLPLPQVGVILLPQLVQSVDGHRSLNSVHKVIAVQDVHGADFTSVAASYGRELQRLEPHIVRLLITDADHHVLSVGVDNAKPRKHILPLVLAQWVKDAEHFAVHTAQEGVVVRADKVWEKRIPANSPC